MSLGNEDDRLASADDEGIVQPPAKCKGIFIRGDNWLNISTDATFKGGLWSAGDATAGAVFEEGYTVNNTSGQLSTTATVKLEVAFDGAEAIITQTIDGKKSFTIDTRNYPNRVKFSGGLYVGLGGENALDISEISAAGEKVDGPYTVFKSSGWNAIGEFKSVVLLPGQTAAFVFKQPAQCGMDNSKSPLPPCYFKRGDWRCGAWCSKSGEVRWDAGGDAELGYAIDEFGAVEAIYKTKSKGNNVFAIYAMPRLMEYNLAATVGLTYAMNRGNKDRTNIGDFDAFAFY